MGSPDSDMCSMCSGYFGAAGRPTVRAGRPMLDRFGLRTTLAVAGTVLTAALAGVPAAAAASVSAAAAPVSASAAASVSPAAIGGAQLSGRGVIVNYTSRSVPRLPGVHA